MFKISALSVDTGRETTPPLVDGVHSQQTGPANYDIYYVISNTFFK